MSDGFKDRYVSGDIEFFLDSEGNWELINQGSPELCSMTLMPYGSMFDLVGKSYNKVLIIGGGDHQLAREVWEGNKEAEIHIVDPSVNDYLKFIPHMYQDSEFSQWVDDGNVRYHPMVYSEFVKSDLKHIKGEFDLVMVDCSGHEVESTSEIYNESFLEDLSTKVKSKEYKMYWPKDASVLWNWLYYHEDFEFSVMSRFIDVWAELANVYSWRPVK